MPDNASTNGIISGIFTSMINLGYVLFHPVVHKELANFKKLTEFFSWWRVQNKNLFVKRCLNCSYVQGTPLYKLRSRFASLLAEAPFPLYSLS